MAEWKKVIVSGSAAVLSQLNVGTTQQITNSQATTFLSGSFTGSFKGDGSGLSGIAASFPTVATTDLATTNQIFVNDGASKYITYGNLVLDLAGSGAGTSNLTTTDTGDSLALTSQISVTGITGSHFGTSSYAIQALSSSFASTVPFSGIIGAPAGAVSSSVLAAGSGQGSTTLTTNGVSSGDITATGLGTAGTPTFAGLTISTNAVAINNTNGITTNAATFPIANSTATTINLGGGATAINIGASTGITTINHDARIKGALYVDGPITAISSSNLYVADQFILLASGSANNTDGGFVIDRGAYASGNIAYGFDSATGRWGYQNNVVDTTNTLDPTSGGNGLSGSFAGYVFTEAAHSATKPLTGEFVQAGAIYTNTDGTIWMYA